MTAGALVVTQAASASCCIDHARHGASGGLENDDAIQGT